MPRITKKYEVKRHTTKIPPIQASLKKNEALVYKNLLEKGKIIKPKKEIHDLDRVADLEKTFSNGDITNWSYELYENTEIVNDTIPSYKINQLTKRYNESSLKKTTLILKENNSVIKKINITYIKANCLCPHTHRY